MAAVKRALLLSKRSTPYDWHKRGAAIGLLKGERKHRLPARPVDGRPVEGMARITAIIGNSRTAWLWLTRQHVRETGETPLDRLKAGHVEEVVADAEFDFGRSSSLTPKPSRTWRSGSSRSTTCARCAGSMPPRRSAWR